MDERHPQSHLPFQGSEKSHHTFHASLGQLLLPVKVLVPQTDCMGMQEFTAPVANTCHRAPVETHNSFGLHLIRLQHLSQ